MYHSKPDRRDRMDNHVKIKNVDCYGEMSPDQNVSICCDDEAFDGVHADGFKNWTEAVNWLLENYRKDIVQLEAV